MTDCGNPPACVHCRRSIMKRLAKYTQV